jgi:two-component system sensor histidine kinase DesK
MLGGMVALIAVAVPFAGSASLTMVVYLGAATMFSLDLTVGTLAVLALAATAEVSARSVEGWQDQQWSSAFSILFAGAAVYASRIAFGRNQALMAAREEMAQMAVEEERSRMTRDLHDILGHSLTVITIKAELAGRLVGADDARASAEVADIERLAREALSDVRATIAGRREVSLAPELVNAREALATANIDAEVPNAVDDVPAANRELFGWAVREGVTNVLRHSKASRCQIRLSGTSVEIHDDGAGAGAVAAEGNGLRGLRERVAGAGASILTGTSPQLGGFLLRVSTSRGPAAGG